jgi:hypothetical protein
MIDPPTAAKTVIEAQTGGTKARFPVVIDRIVITSSTVPTTNRAEVRA